MAVSSAFVDWCGSGVPWEVKSPYYVDFSMCFEGTVLMAGPFLLLIVLGLLRVITLARSQPLTGPLTWSHSFILKMLGSVLLFVVILVEMIHVAINYTGSQGAPTYQLVSKAVMTSGSAFAIILLYYEHQQHRRSSTVLSLCWFLMFGVGVIRARSLAMRWEDDRFTDLLLFVCFWVYFSLTFILFIFGCIPEPRSAYDPLDGDHDPCPEGGATLWSVLTFWWMNGIMRMGFKKPLTSEDLFGMPAGESCRELGEKFQGEWEKELKKEKPVLGKALFRGFGSTFVAAGFFKIVQDSLNFVSPVLLKDLINFTEDTNEPMWKGYGFAFLLFLTAVVQSFFLHQYFHRCFRTGMRLRSAVINAVYKKALRLSNSARQSSTVGEIVNLMSIDAQRFQDVAAYLHILWSAPYQIALSLYFLYNTMGPSIFAGVGVMILMIPLNGFIAVKMRALQKSQMKAKDGRIKLMSEILNGIKVIKLYAWEIPFIKQVYNVREQELKVLKRSAYLNAGVSFVWSCTPFLVSLATFLTYSLLGNPLTADKAFVALSLFNILQFPLASLPMLMSSVVEMSVSHKRLQKFLLLPDLDTSAVERNMPSGSHGGSATGGATLGSGEAGLSIQGGTFKWTDTGPTVLESIDLKIGAGTLTAVVGTVGAGKSSLVSSILGDMEKLHGRVTLTGSVAYVPQQAWVQNATLRDNILFGMPYDESRYLKVVHACALSPDIEMLPGGDQTEIGEKGINLSGGQKQRVSLARAVYADADVYILDDPLSAVDSHVGAHIFDNVIGPRGLLSGKVRLLVTHGIGFLSQTNCVVVIKNRQVSEVGSYSDLLEAGGEFSRFIEEYGTDAPQDENNGERDASGSGDEDGGSGSETAGDVAVVDADGKPVTQATAGAPMYHDDDDKQVAPGRSINDPETPERHNAEARRARFLASRAQSRDVQVSSKSSTNGGKVSAMGDVVEEKNSAQAQDLAAIAAAEAALKKKSELIAEEKAEKGSVSMAVVKKYILAVGKWMSLLTIMCYMAGQAMAIGSNLWLSKWTSDTSSEPDYVNSHLGLYLGVYAGLGIGMGVMVLVVAFVQAIATIIGARMLHKDMLQTIMRSPMSFFDTTPVGRVINRFSKDIYAIDEAIPRSIRSFLATFFKVISVIIVIAYATRGIFLVAILPLGVFYVFLQRFYVATARQLKRLDSVTRSPIYAHFGETVTGVATIRAYDRVGDFIQQNEDRVDSNQRAYYPNIAANRWLAVRLEIIGNLIVLLAGVFAVLGRKFGIDPGLVGLSVSYALNVTQSLNWMVRMSSQLETDIVAVERVKEYTELPVEAPPVVASERPASNWPERGDIVFRDFSVRYRDDLELVLRNINVDIAGGEKVGICGRTGAGKSSLTLCLFRLLESAGGSITIDGRNIARMGLDDLRSRLTIIPQDPVLFSGTMRLNLDPFDAYEDVDLWRALERAHLKEFVSGLPDKLEAPVAEGGDNLSVGQRQLVCLARALLRKTRVLILDEATAAVDLETDTLIQATIRSEFSDCTVITIAHRINTIMDSSRILVLDAGRVAELDTPAALMADRSTIFYSMAMQAGITSAQGASSSDV